MLTASVSPIAEIDGCEAASRISASAEKKSETPLSTPAGASRLLTQHFRCPNEFIDLTVDDAPSSGPGYFQFGPDAICYGRCSSGTLAPTVTNSLYDALDNVTFDRSSIRLPFDPVQIVNNLRHERYESDHPISRSANKSSSLVRRLYYMMRPLLSVGLRKHLQRVYLGDWRKIPFPHWPVDSTVESIHEQLLVLSMKAQNLTTIPFIWFWPKGALSCTSVTHDVETTTGWDFCSQLMDLDDSFGIKSAFQVVPEERYTVQQERLDAMKARGFELNVHDLNHDGNLMTDRDEFLRRVPGINQYGKEFGALGFRAAVLYRNIDWYDALEFSYDMSVPNVAHLDPQRGGCCTIFPFFNGKMIELPVTMAQDYSLFHILKDYSINLWKKQSSLIREKHGLIQFIVHPDYIIGPDERRVYADLLGYLADLREDGKTWIALPAEIAAWWRTRNELSLVKSGGSWRIQGEGHDDARIAYAKLVDGRLEYEIDPGS